MTDVSTVQATEAEKSKAEKKPREPKAKSTQRRPQTAATTTQEVAELKEWLQTLEIGVIPSLKINGAHHPTAIVVVDLGQPVKQIRLTNEQTSELAQRLRRSAREILGRDAAIRISVDNNHGIHWAGISA